MDVQMPVMDGLEATRRIRALAGRRQPRICAMSASVLDEERQACIDAGMDRHLSKPFRRAELAALLDDIAGMAWTDRSEEHTSELQSLMRISYAVFCLKKKKTTTIPIEQSRYTSTETNKHQPTA